MSCKMLLDHLPFAYIWMWTRPMPVASIELSSPRMTLVWLDRGAKEVNQEWCEHIVRDALESISQLCCRLLCRSLALVLYTHSIVCSVVGTGGMGVACAM